MDEIRKDYEAYAIHRYDWGHIGPELPSERLGKGTSLADAIRNAGIRCETCEHLIPAWEMKKRYETDTPHGHCAKIGHAPNSPDFFCANHSELI